MYKNCTELLRLFEFLDSFNLIPNYSYVVEFPVVSSQFNSYLFPYNLIPICSYTI